MEVGGRTLKRTFQRSNPTATPGCMDPECIACKDERGKRGNCRRNKVNYEIECHLCADGGRPVYIGETSRNLYCTQEGRSTWGVVVVVSKGFTALSTLKGHLSAKT